MFKMKFKSIKTKGKEKRPLSEETKQELLKLKETVWAYLKEAGANEKQCKIVCLYTAFGRGMAFDDEMKDNAEKFADESIEIELKIFCDMFGVNEEEHDLIEFYDSDGWEEVERLMYNELMNV